MTIPTSTHQAQSIIMVRPNDFGFNEETNTDNAFQNAPQELSNNEITQLAQSEFDAMIALLDKNHIDILVFEHHPTTIKLPDAIFPNNWFSTQPNGALLIYPMKTANRQAEVQIEPLRSKLEKNNFQINEVIDLRKQLPELCILEGTGCLVFHHPSKNVFATYSERCHLSALKYFCERFSYQLNAFESRTHQGKAIYHTNVLMSCGEDFAVLTEEVITQSKESQPSIDTLKNSVNDVVTISEAQMTESFCANIIQIKDKNNQSCIVMSSSAYEGFQPEQLKQLEKHGNILICDISTIEHVGGGSARCMIAENFLPRLNTF